MSISKRERNILLLMALVAAIFVVTNVMPLVRGVYNDRIDLIDGIQLDLERERRLTEETGTWRERRVEAEEKIADLESHVFSGDTIPLIEANIQAAISRHARDSGLTVSSTRLAEQQETGDWIVVSQEVSFRTVNAGNTLAFLQKLEESTPRLRISDFSLTRSRNQFSGSITVVGFARSVGINADAANQEGGTDV